MISLKQAESAEEAAIILKDPEIFHRITEDGQLIDDFIIPFDEHHLYLMIILDDTPIGLYNMHPNNLTTLTLHCNILKKYRDYANIAGHLFYDWILSECPEQFQKFITEIPVIYPEVYYYTKRFGFKDEGMNRLSTKKNGEYVDQWRVGITKQEIVSWLQQ